MLPTFGGEVWSEGSEKWKKPSQNGNGKRKSHRQGYEKETEEQWNHQVRKRKTGDKILFRIHFSK